MKKYGLEVLAFIILVTGMWLYGAATYKHIDPVYVPSKEATARHGYLEVMKMDEDTIKLLDLSAYKWKVRFPKTARSVTLWIEDWRRADKQPRIIFRNTLSLNPEISATSPEPDSLLVKWPDRIDDRFRISLEGTNVSSPQPQLITENWPREYKVSIGAITYDSPSQDIAIGKDIFPIAIGEDILLTGKGLTGNRVYSSILSDEEITKNLRTALLKMQVNESDGHYIPVWKNGKIVFVKFQNAYR